MVNLNDLLAFLAISSLQFQGWCHSKISFLVGHLCKSCNWFILSLFTSPRLVSVVFLSFPSFSIALFLKRFFFFSYYTVFFLGLLFISPASQPLARAGVPTTIRSPVLHSWRIWWGRENQQLTYLQDRAFSPSAFLLWKWACPCSQM